MIQFLPVRVIALASMMALQAMSYIDHYADMNYFNNSGRFFMLYNSKNEYLFGC
jgi:hypothetical protein